MNRKILAAGFVAIAFSFTLSCSEGSDCTLQDPSHNPDASRAINILVLSAMYHPSLPDIIPDSLEDTGLLPDDSRIDLFRILDSERDLHVPVFDFLQQYDAVIIFTETWPADEGDYARYDTIGELLADYIDDGGGLVLCQYAMYDGSARIRGRICSSGYAPLTTGPLDVESRDDRSLLLDSIEFPLHPVFSGIDIAGLLLPGEFLAYPQLDATAILLAEDNHASNAIAINASGSIIGLNMSAQAFAFPDYKEAVNLIVNCLIHVADADRS